MHGALSPRSAAQRPRPSSAVARPSIALGAGGTNPFVSDRFVVLSSATAVHATLAADWSLSSGDDILVAAVTIDVAGFDFNGGGPMCSA
jgi:hypothetical protein